MVMNITINCEDLQRAVEWTTKVSRADHVLMDLGTDGYATFRAEGDIGMRSHRVAYRSDTDITDKLTYSFSSPHLIKMQSALSQKKADGPITIRLDDNAREARAVYAYMNIPIAILSSAGKLPSDNEKFEPVGYVDYDEWMETLRTCDHVTGSQHGAVSMIDITFDYKNSVIKAMGTDKFTLVAITLPFQKYGVDDDKENSRFPIQPDLGSLRAKSSRVYLEESEESLRVSYDDGEVATIRKQSAKPLPWEKIKEAALDEEARKDEMKFIIDVNDLAVSSRIAMSYVDPTSTRQILTLKLDDDRIAVSAISTETASDKLIVIAENATDGTIMRFAYDEFKKALDSVASDRVEIRYAGDDVPVIFEQVKPTGDIDDSAFILTKTSPEID